MKILLATMVCVALLATQVVGDVVRVFEATRRDKIIILSVADEAKEIDNIQFSLAVSPITGFTPKPVKGAVELVEKKTDVYVLKINQLPADRIICRIAFNQTPASAVTISFRDITASISVAPKQDFVFSKWGKVPGKDVPDSSVGDKFLADIDSAMDKTPDKYVNPKEFGFIVLETGEKYPDVDSSIVYTIHTIESSLRKETIIVNGSSGALGHGQQKDFWLKEYRKANNRIPNVFELEGSIELTFFAVQQLIEEGATNREAIFRAYAAPTKTRNIIYEQLADGSDLKDYLDKSAGIYPIVKERLEALKPAWEQEKALRQQVADSEKQNQADLAKIAELEEGLREIKTIKEQTEEMAEDMKSLLSLYQAPTPAVSAPVQASQPVAPATASGEPLDLSLYKGILDGLLAVVQKQAETIDKQAESQGQTAMAALEVANRGSLSRGGSFVAQSSQPKSREEVVMEGLYGPRVAGILLYQAGLIAQTPKQGDVLEFVPEKQFTAISSLRGGSKIATINGNGFDQYASKGSVVVSNRQSAIITAFSGQADIAIYKFNPGCFGQGLRQLNASFDTSVDCIAQVVLCDGKGQALKIYDLESLKRGVNPPETQNGLQVHFVVFQGRVIIDELVMSSKNFGLPGTL